jgi:hypothetical protein
MNRCIPCCTLRATSTSLFWQRSAFLLAQSLSIIIMLWISILPALGQIPLPSTRPIPATAQRAVLEVLQPPVILINGQQERLSPGARIRDRNNMLVLSGTLIGQNLPVAFVREPLGLVHEVWILNEGELQRPASGSPSINARSEYQP